MPKPIYRDIEIRGVIYPDVRTAAQALGIDPGGIRKAIRSGTQHRLGTGVRGVEPMPVRVRGIDFATVKEAAAHFGVSAGAVRRAIYEGRTDRFLLPRRGGSRSKPITIAGVTYPSQAEASRCLGLRADYISHALGKRSLAAVQRILAIAEQPPEPAQRVRRKGKRGGL